MATKSKRKAHEEEHVNHERWLVTYADMITLLMVLFIVLFAMSSVDQRKFNALKAGLADGFGQTSVLQGSESILDEQGTAAVAPVSPQESEGMTPAQQKAVQAAVSRRATDAAQQRQAEATHEASRLLDIQKKVLAALRKNGLEDDVRTAINERGLIFSLVSRHVVFQANRAELTERGRRVVAAMTPVLRTLENTIEVDGHTNQAKGKPQYYASDWDLSAARAIAVVRTMVGEGGVSEKQLVASAFGHTRPLVDPSKPGSQELNKRVDVVVRSDLPAESAALLGIAAQTLTKGQS